MNNTRLKKWIVIISTVILIIIMGVTMGGRERITLLENTIGNILVPIQKGFYSLGNAISQRIEPIANVWEIKDINEKLVKENELLKEELIKNTLSQLELNELRELKESLHYIDDMGIENYITCNVVAKDQGNWYHMFTIDRGLNDGVTKNSSVINGSGLIGLVYDVGKNWSKVISIIDNKASIGFQVLDYNDNYFGQLNGSFDYRIKGYFFDPQAEIEVGKTLITSGLGVYPKGILIGEVEVIDKNINSLLMEIKVKPFVDFKKIDKVVVIPYEKLE